MNQNPIAPSLSSYLFLVVLLFTLSVFSAPALAADADNDGYDSAVDDCVDDPAGLGGIPGDQINPGAAETWYDGVDQNCDGWNDYDQDQDGYVFMNFPGTSGGTSLGEGDCDDNDATIHPGALEIPDDGVDQDCNGLELCYRDNDNDGYRPDATATVNDNGDFMCNDSGEAAASDPTGDCNDNAATVYTGAPELCDGIDNDCDELTDQEDPDLAPAPCANQTGVCAGSTALCSGGAWQSCDAGDYAAWSPDYETLETSCDGQDNDCDGQVDEGCVFDADGDGLTDDQEDTNCNGDPTDDDIDGDGLANYLDDDDDDDGVLTANEDSVIPDGDPSNDDADSDGVIDAFESNVDDQDTDGTVDRLDDDDDGDGIPTASEDLDADGCWYDDDADADGIPDYLDDTFDCPYQLAGELTGDCRVDIEDFAVVASSWLTDCILNPADPDCIPLNPVGSCDNNGFTAVSESATYYTGSQYLVYGALSSASAPKDQMIIEIDQSSGPSTPGTYTLTDENYADSVLSVLIYADCDGSMNCSKIFLADSGTLDITSIGGVGSTFAGTLSNVNMVEVTIDPGTFVSTPVPGGQTWCITSYPFSAEIVAP